MECAKQKSNEKQREKQTADRAATIPTAAAAHPAATHRHDTNVNTPTARSIRAITSHHEPSTTIVQRWFDHDQQDGHQGRWPWADAAEMPRIRSNAPRSCKDPFPPHAHPSIHSIKERVLDEHRSPTGQHNNFASAALLLCLCRTRLPSLFPSSVRVAFS